MIEARKSRTVRIEGDGFILEGNLVMPSNPEGMILFAHGSGSSRHSPRNRFVAEILQQAGLGTLLFDLLTPQEDMEYQERFNIPLLAQRLIFATQWLENQSALPELAIGYFGASTGAAAALMAAAELEEKIQALVSRGGRPDLAMDYLDHVKTPSLFIVGERDELVLDWNLQAMEKLRSTKEIQIIPGATHLFEEAGTLEQVADLAKAWFLRFLAPA